MADPQYQNGGPQYRNGGPQYQNGGIKHFYSFLGPYINSCGVVNGGRGRGMSGRAAARCIVGAGPARRPPPSPGIRVIAQPCQARPGSGLLGPGAPRRSTAPAGSPAIGSHGAAGRLPVRGRKSDPGGSRAGGTSLVTFWPLSSSTCGSSSYPDCGERPRAPSRRESGRRRQLGTCQPRAVKGAFAPSPRAPCDARRRRRAALRCAHVRAAPAIGRTTVHLPRPLGELQTTDGWPWWGPDAAPRTAERRESVMAPVTNGQLRASAISGS